MLSLPSAAEPLIVSLSVAFTEPTFKRIMPLIVGAILTTGRHTVAALLRTVRDLATGHCSDYHRVFSRAVWSPWGLARILAGAILAWVPADEPVLVAMDDTTAQHRGKKVYGKGCHRDAVRSTHSLVVWRWGHKWVVLAIVVKFPFLKRRWALPALTALYRPEELNRKEGRRHKTPAHLARQLAAALMHWFPGRKFVFLGDGGFASHEWAGFAHRHRRRATLIARFHADASLYELPPAVKPNTKRKQGRPRVKGAKLPTPGEVVAKARRRRATVDWYGGSSRKVELVHGNGQWYRSGEGLVPVRWVYTHDVQGTHRDDYFYSTDPTLDPAQIVSWFTGRWPIETTFQEMRAQLGFETTRQRTEKSVLRTGPCLLGLFSLICLVYAEYRKDHSPRLAQTDWYVKAEPTFADAIATVRRLFWQQTIFGQPCHNEAFQKIPARLRNLLLDCLCRAA
jgi:hypothetical protein